MKKIFLVSVLVVIITLSASFAMAGGCRFPGWSIDAYNQRFSAVYSNFNGNCGNTEVVGETGSQLGTSVKAKGLGCLSLKNSNQGSQYIKTPNVEAHQWDSSKTVINMHIPAPRPPHCR